MLKTYNINLAGQIFHINEDAFDLLSTYLQSLKKIYQYEDGGDEIIRDIEARISEIVLAENKMDSKKIIDIEQVRRIISTLGSPEQHSDEFIGEDSQDTNTFSNATNETATKKMFRDADQQIISGVCAGLSQYLGINDPIWIRLLFVVSVFAGFGTGILAYIVLWILLPEAKTASEKLQMKGQPINLENIEKIVKQGIQNVNDTLENPSWNKASKGIGGIITGVFKGLYKIIKAFVLIILLIIVVTLIFTLFIGGFSSLALAPTLANFIFESSLLAYVTIGSIFVLFAVTSLFLILLPFQMFSKDKRPLKKPVGITLGVLWIGALLISILGSIDAFRHFSIKMKDTNEEIIQAATLSDTIVIETIPNDFSYGNIGIHWNDWKVVENGVYNGMVEMNIAQSPDEDIHIFEELSAYGSSMKVATVNVNNIDYQYSRKGDTLTFNSFVGSVKENPKFRGQKSVITLYIPEGKTIIFKDKGDIIKKTPRLRDLDGDPAIHTENSSWKLEKGYIIPLSLGVTSIDMSDWNDVTTGVPFEQIDIDGYVDVEIYYSENQKVLINDPSLVNVRNIAGELKIDMASNITKTFSNKAPVRVKIYTPNFNELDMDGLTKTLLSGFNDSNAKIKLDGSSDLKLENNTFAFLQLDVDGISKVEGYAMVENARIKVDGTSKFEGDQIKIQNLYIDMDGISKGTVMVEKLIQGKIGGVSKLTYSGQPNIQVQTSGQGKIVKK